MSWGYGLKMHDTCAPPDGQQQQCLSGSINLPQDPAPQGASSSSPYHRTKRATPSLLIHCFDLHALAHECNRITQLLGCIRSQSLPQLHTYKFHTQVHGQAFWHEGRPVTLRAFAQQQPTSAAHVPAICMPEPPCLPHTVET